jgi:hypothetical protein
MKQTRAQTTTIEGVIGALLIVGVVFFIVGGGLGGGSPEVAGQQSEMTAISAEAESAIEFGVADGSLHEALLAWDTDNKTYHGVAPGSATGYANLDSLPPELSEHFDTTLSQSKVVNIDVVYRTGEGGVESHSLLDQGSAAAFDTDGVTASETLVLLDSDTLTAGPSSGTSLGAIADDEFYIPDVSPDTHVYNTVRVEVTIWGGGR